YSQMKYNIRKCGYDQICPENGRKILTNNDLTSRWSVQEMDDNTLNTSSFCADTSVWENPTFVPHRTWDKIFDMTHEYIFGLKCFTIVAKKNETMKRKFQYHSYW